MSSKHVLVRLEVLDEEGVAALGRGRGALSRRRLVVVKVIQQDALPREDVPEGRRGLIRRPLPWSSIAVRDSKDGRAVGGHVVVVVAARLVVVVVTLMLMVMVSSFVVVVVEDELVGAGLVREEQVAYVDVVDGGVVVFPVVVGVATSEAAAEGSSSKGREGLGDFRSLEVVGVLVASSCGVVVGVAVVEESQGEVVVAVDCFYKSSRADLGLEEGRRRRRRFEGPQGEGLRGLGGAGLEGRTDRIRRRRVVSRRRVRRDEG
mmetsp:Transcript_15371/g.50276  ORF Transcript_15371/g.50276 Transcript_15371/m.50276 type:complete len:262 (+) Transcript_15371:172-957(+)